MFLIHFYLNAPKVALQERLTSQENFETFLKFSQTFFLPRTRSPTWPSLHTRLTGSSELRLASNFELHDSKDIKSYVASFSQPKQFCGG